MKSNNELNYSLHNLENYNKDLECDVGMVVEKLSQLLINYFRFIVENLKLRKSSFSKFIIIRGLDTITHVFNYLLFYTKNLDMTYFHCQKAYYFYVEFVGQISEDEKMFLQLSSKDATTYVYKKTIYDINNEAKKISEDISDYTKIKLGIINSYIESYKTLLLHLINNDYANLDFLKLLEEIFKKLSKLPDKTSVEKLNNIVEKLYYYVTDIEKFYNIVNIIVKKMSKTPNILENKLDKFLTEDFLDKLNETPEKFVTWFIN